MEAYKLILIALLPDFFNVSLLVLLYQEELTAFLQASVGGHVPVMRLLVELKCNTEARDKVSRLLLYWWLLHL
jgi:hypothetical protein